MEKNVKTRKFDWIGFIGFIILAVVMLIASIR